jgi:hypothetical protein
MNAVIHNNLVELDYSHGESDAPAYAQRCAARIEAIANADTPLAPGNAFLMLGCTGVATSGSAEWPAPMDIESKLSGSPKKRPSESTMRSISTFPRWHGALTLQVNSDGRFELSDQPCPCKGS